MKRDCIVYGEMLTRTERRIVCLAQSLCNPRGWYRMGRAGWGWAPWR